MCSMGQVCSCSGCFAVGGSTTPRYARYRANTDTDVDLENIVGEILDLDPVLCDPESGMLRINKWIDEISPLLESLPVHIEVSRSKCLKYWQAQKNKDASKLSGSSIRFCFEKQPEDEVPRLLIDHRGSLLSKSRQSNIFKESRKR